MVALEITYFIEVSLLYLVIKWLNFSFSSYKCSNKYSGGGICRSSTYILFFRKSVIKKFVFNFKLKLKLSLR